MHETLTGPGRAVGHGHLEGVIPSWLIEADVDRGNAGNAVSAEFDLTFLVGRVLLEIYGALAVHRFQGDAIACLALDDREALDIEGEDDFVSWKEARIRADRALNAISRPDVGQAQRAGLR